MAAGKNSPSDSEIQANRLEWTLDALSFIFDISARKRLILEARAPEVGILTDEQTQRLIATLGLGPA